MRRKQIVAGNWKMNKTFEEGKELAEAVAAGLSESDTIAILAPPFIHLSALSVAVQQKFNLRLAAQNCHQEKGGAYTGEISVDMLRSVGVEYVILGHSERREYFGEEEELLAKKVDIVLEAGLKPIFCCGEKLPVREAGTHTQLVAKQIRGALFHLSAEAFANIVIAYEPVWAIGTGVTASPAQAQEMHAVIRQLVADQYGIEVAHHTTILYGGSVKPGNAKELFSQPDVDGGLVGGASLKAADFLAIIDSF